MRWFALVKFASVGVLAACVVTLITGDLRSTTGDALIAVSALWALTAGVGEERYRKTYARMRYFRARYKEEVNATIERALNPGDEGYTNGPRMPYCSPENCANAGHYPPPEPREDSSAYDSPFKRDHKHSFGQMSVDDIERSQGA